MITTYSVLLIIIEQVSYVVFFLSYLMFWCFVNFISCSKKYIKHFNILIFHAKLNCKLCISLFRYAIKAMGIFPIVAYYHSIRVFDWFFYSLCKYLIKIGFNYQWCILNSAKHSKKEKNPCGNVESIAMNWSRFLKAKLIKIINGILRALCN